MMGNTGIVHGQKVSRVKLQRAKELRRVMTPQETALWQRLRGGQLNGLHFRRQQVIDGFVADFYCHAAGVVVELDGPIHEQQADYDQERDKVIAAHNLVIVRITNAEFETEPGQALQRISKACRERRQALNDMTDPKAPLPFREGAGG